MDRNRSIKGKVKKLQDSKVFKQNQENDEVRERVRKRKMQKRNHGPKCVYN